MSMKIQCNFIFDFRNQNNDKTDISDSIEVPINYNDLVSLKLKIFDKDFSDFNNTCNDNNGSSNHYNIEGKRLIEDKINEVQINDTITFKNEKNESFDNHKDSFDNDEFSNIDNELDNFDFEPLPMSNCEKTINETQLIYKKDENENDTYKYMDYNQISNNEDIEFEEVTENENENKEIFENKKDGNKFEDNENCFKNKIENSSKIKKIMSQISLKPPKWAEK